MQFTKLPSPESIEVKSGSFGSFLLPAEVLFLDQRPFGLDNAGVTPVLCNGG
jgi:hypothetical protein